MYGPESFRRRMVSMSGPTPDPSELISEAAKVLAEPINNVLSPPTRELGDFLGTIANLCRFYATENLAKIFKKWAEYRRGERPLNREDLRKVMPLLPAASMVSDDELQEKWVRLMESATCGDSHSPAFGQTLAQLSAEDVRFLDKLWVTALIPLYNHVYPMQSLSFITLVRAFDPGINTGVNDPEFRVYGNQWTDEQKANYENFQRAKLVIDSVIRLGVLREKQEVRELDRVVGLDALNESRREVTIKAGAIRVHVEYSFSPYGVAFMEAVTWKDRDAKE